MRKHSHVRCASRGRTHLAQQRAAVEPLERRTHLHSAPVPAINYLATFDPAPASPSTPYDFKGHAAFPTSSALHWYEGVALHLTGLTVGSLSGTVMNADAPGDMAAVKGRFQWNLGIGDDPATPYNDSLFEGFNVAHVFEPGQYQITLVVTNEFGDKSDPKTVNLIVDSTIAVSGSTTSRQSFFVDSEATVNGSGTASSPFNLQGLKNALASTGIGPNARIRFRNRTTPYDLSSYLNITKSNLLFDTWDPNSTGAQAIIRRTADDSTFIVTSAASNITIRNLTFTTNDDSTGHSAIRIRGDNVAVIGCNFVNLGSSSYAINSEYTLNADLDRGGILLQNNATQGLLGYFLFDSVKNDVVVVGNIASTNNANNGALRFMVPSAGAGVQSNVLDATPLARVLVEHNTLRNTGGGKAVRLHWSNFAYVSQNTISSNADIAIWTGGTGGPDSGQVAKDEEATNIVLERNVVEGAYEAQWKSSHIVVRNNFVSTILSFDIARGFQVDGRDATRTVSDIWYINNTVSSYHSSTVASNFIRVRGGSVPTTATGLHLLNNLLVDNTTSSGSNTRSPVYVEDDDLSAFASITGNDWPTNAKNYIASRSNPTISQSDWNGGTVFPQVGHDTFASVTLAADSLTPLGTTANVASYVAGVFVDRGGYARPSSGTWTAGAVQLPPTAPTVQSATPVSAATAVQVTWTDNSDNESAFEILASTSPTFDTFVGSPVRVASNTGTGTFSAGLMPGTLYYFKVRSIIDAPGTIAISSLSSGYVSATTSSGLNGYTEVRVGGDPETQVASFNQSAQEYTLYSAGYGVTTDVAPDQLNFLYKEYASDFDVATKVTSLPTTIGSNHPTAGLSVRAGTGGTDANFSIRLTNEGNIRVSWRAPSDTEFSRTPADYPDPLASASPRWLRMRRSTVSGVTTWYAYAGYEDAVDHTIRWRLVQMLSSASLGITGTVKVGMTLAGDDVNGTSHATAVTATFKSPINVTGTQKLLAVGTSSSDNWYLRANGSNLEVRLGSASTSPLFWSEPIDRIGSFEANGQLGDDQLTLDFTGGALTTNDAATQALYFDGGGGSLDMLVIRCDVTGATTPLVAAADKLYLGASAISHVGVERRAYDLRGGTYSFNTAVPIGSPDVSLTASGSAQVSIGTAQRLNVLTISGTAGVTLVAGGGNTLLMKSLAVSAGGKLDLNDNDAIIDYAAADPSPIDTIRQYLLSGRNGGAWNGSGIVTSAGAADTDRRTAIGYLESSAYGSPFSGQDTDATSVLLKYTWYGDANFSGKINADDYTLTDVGHATGNARPHVWQWGDFDYDGQTNSSGVVDTGDYLLIDKSYAKQSGTLSPGFADERESQFGSAYKQALLAVADRAGEDGPGLVYVPDDIGSPTVVGSTTGITAGSDYNLSAGGTGFGTTSDQFQFAWQLLSGDFDLRVNVAALGMTPGNLAGLMARASLDPSAWMTFAGVARTSAGAITSRTGSRATDGSYWSHDLGANVDFEGRQWVRLRRVGDAIYGYASADAVSWTPWWSGSVPANTPDLYVGMAAAAGNATGTNAVQFRHLGATPAQSELTLPGTSGDDVWYVRRDPTGQSVQVWNHRPITFDDPSDPPTFTYSYDSISGLVFNGQGGDDQLFLDQANGPLRFTDHITFDGGDGDDAMTILGTSNDDAYYRGATSDYFITGGPDYGTGVTVGHAAVEGYYFEGRGGTTDLYNFPTGSWDVGYDMGTATPALKIFGGAGTVIDLSVPNHVDYVRLDGGVVLLADPSSMLWMHAWWFTNGGHIDLSAGSLVVTQGGYPWWSLPPGFGQTYDGGLWDGGGAIVSSAAAASGGLTGIGYATAGQLGISTWGGEAIASGSCVFKYTYVGDMNLDGKVDSDDLALFTAYGGSNGGGADWSSGDFNYDGVRDATDYAMMMNAYANQGAVL